MKGDQGTRIYYVPVNTRWMRWYRASVRRDLREIGALGGEETEDERQAIEDGPSDVSPPG
jgi:hypothetical protein